MAEVKYKLAESFKLDMAYLADLPNFMKEYEERFLEDSKVNVVFSQEIDSGAAKSYPETITLSEDKMIISIKYKMTRYWIKPGKLSDLKTPTEFYLGLRFIMNRAVQLQTGEAQE